MSKIYIFEGLDLSGKSTAVKNLEKELKNLGHDVAINNGPLEAQDILSDLRQIFFIVKPSSVSLNPKE